VQALDGLTFTVPPGQVFGFLGPNGAGKTTAMRAIVGVAAMDSGTVRWEVSRSRWRPGCSGEMTDRWTQIRLWVDATGPALAYREGMGKLLLILLVAFAVFMLISLVVSALHFLFWIALVVLVVFGALRLTSALRHSPRR
jgi:energy-coupling factor transporter ATP-binding protein EcfA2